MENKKDIGKAFNEKLSALNQTPNEKIWQNIHAELEKKKKRRIGFFFLWSGIAGFVLLGLFGTYYFYNQNSGFKDLPKTTSTETTVGNPNIKDNKDSRNNLSTQESGNNLENGNSIGNDKLDNSESPDNNENSITNGNSDKNIESSNKSNSKTSVTTGKTNLKTGLKSTKNSNSFKEKFAKTSKTKGTKSLKWSKKSNKKSKNKKGNSVEKETSSNQNLDALKGTESTTDSNSLKKADEVAAKKTDTTSAKKPKEKEITINMYPKDSIQKDSAKTYKKFDIDVFASPTSYGYFAKNSTLDNRLDSNTKSSGITWSYGIGLGYDLTERLSIRIGYSKTSLSFTTKDALVNTSNYTRIDYGTNITNQSIYNASNNAETMDITQNISYSEIPLEVRYKLFDKKISLGVIGGFSYLALSENNIKIKTSNGFSQKIGETEGLAKTSLSINIGAGIDYEIFKNMKVFAEPMFNYQIKAFENSNFKPYYFGIHTGIRYSFNN